MEFQLIVRADSVVGDRRRRRRRAAAAAAASFLAAGSAAAVLVAAAVAAILLPLADASAGAGAGGAAGRRLLLSAASPTPSSTSAGTTEGIVRAGRRRFSDAADVAGGKANKSSLDVAFWREPRNGRRRGERNRKHSSTASKFGRSSAAFLKIRGGGGGGDSESIGGGRSGNEVSGAPGVADPQASAAAAATVQDPPPAKPVHQAENGGGRTADASSSSATNRTSDPPVAADADGGGGSSSSGTASGVGSGVSTAGRGAPAAESSSGPTVQLQEGASVDAPPAANNETTINAPRLPEWKAKLPDALRRKGSSFQKLALGGVDVYVLGTAHVSNDSSRDVDLLLNCVRPEAVFVELCESRIPLLESGNDGNKGGIENSNSSSTAANSNATDETFWERLTSIQQSQGGSRLQALSTLLLTSLQEDYARDLDVELGGEFQRAYAYWKGARRRAAAGRGGPTGQQQPEPIRPHLILGDRPMQITLIRAWESLWWWPKVKVLAGLLWSSLRKPNPDELREWLESILREESDVLTKSFEELKRHFPTLYETIVAERDAWLAAKLVQTCRGFSGRSSSSQQQQRPCTVVAIVGAGHVPGICQWLTNSTSTKTPEQILGELVTTRRWAKDEAVQKEAIPMWVNDVQELQDLPDDDQSFTWAEPSPPS